VEIALGMNVLKILPANEESRFILGKIGFFLLDDEMTRVNFNFINDVCYKGAFELKRSLKEGKPLGLEVFGYEGKTIYEVLSSLPEQVKKSWFEFDHFYSDISFEEALPIVFSGSPKKIIDIGGNTAKWAICCCRYNPDVEVLIVDLPGQTTAALKEIEKVNLCKRIKTFPCNVLDNNTVIPSCGDVIWMSQFLDCFSLDEISLIMQKIRKSVTTSADIFILEPFWDKQQFEAASYSLKATSLYFTCMANGNSKMYSFNEFKNVIENSGFELLDAHHNLGSNKYSLLRCRRNK